VTRTLALLILGSVAFWLVLSYPARLLWGESALMFSGVACLLCLLPAVATLFWCLKKSRTAPQQVVLAVMGGMGLRMFFVLGVGMVLFHAIPELHYQRFWVWVVVFYLYTLMLEVTLVLKRQAAVAQSKNPS
jgi:hypothetical protein